MSDDLTKAVEAAAQRCFELSREEISSILPPKTAARLPQWDEVRPVEKLQWRQKVLPLVEAALNALPNRDRGLWLEGFYAHDVGIREEACPYPSS